MFLFGGFNIVRTGFGRYYTTIIRRNPQNPILNIKAPTIRLLLSSVFRVQELLQRVTRKGSMRIGSVSFAQSP